MSSAEIIIPFRIKTDRDHSHFLIMLKGELNKFDCILEISY